MKVGTRVRQVVDGKTGVVTAYNESYASPSLLIRLFLAHEQNTPHVQVEWDDGFDTWIEELNDHMWTPVAEVRAL